jgi:hypothetical protein
MCNSSANFCPRIPQGILRISIDTMQQLANFEKTILSTRVPQW